MQEKKVPDKKNSAEVSAIKQTVQALNKRMIATCLIDVSKGNAR